jgi:hypothetical protein
MASSQGIPPAWSKRGYVPPEQLTASDENDDKGEAAYMRCFHESSKIGRVPNASFFANSPSARAYLEKRDKELFPVKEVSDKPIPNPDLPSWLSKKEEASKTQHQSGPNPVVLFTNSPQSIPSLKQTQLPPSHEAQQPPQHIPPFGPTSSDQNPIPWSVEPQTGANGPPRMIR